MDIDKASEARNGELLDVSAAACVFHHPTVANYFTVELIILKEMSEALADLFGLTLPVS
jgi:hypothetical protein